MDSADLRAWLQWLLRVLNRSPWSLRRALGELGQALADPVAVEDCQGMLYAWAAVVTEAVTPEDQAGIPADILPARVDSADRQAAALRVARERGKVTVADLRQQCPPFCGEVYRRDLALMVADGRLQAVGTNKGRYYALRGWLDPYAIKRRESDAQPFPKSGRWENMGGVAGPYGRPDRPFF